MQRSCLRLLCTKKLCDHKAMYARRLTIALAAIAGAAVLEGIAAIWALNLANDHVLRGRVASDIQLSFEELTISKLRLRAWFTQAQLDPGTADNFRKGYVADSRPSAWTAVRRRWLNIESDRTRWKCWKKACRCWKPLPPR
jgi:hypothetical protein